MDSARKLAPTHHVYIDEATGAPFSITDRVLLRFREALDARPTRATPWAPRPAARSCR